MLRDGEGSGGYAVVVAEFRTMEDADAASALADPAKSCSGDDYALALRDGRVFILVTASGGRGSARQATIVESIADEIDLRTGAQRIC